MRRFHFPLVALITTSLALGVMALRAAVPAVSEVGSVSPAAPMLEARSGHSAILLPDGKVLIAGGMRRNQDFYRSAELYDPATGKFQPTGEMSHSSCRARSQIAAVGQSAHRRRMDRSWMHGFGRIYDPTTGKFAAISKMTARRGRPSATLLANGDVLIAGGADHDTPGGIASAEIFHASTLKFEAVGSMHHARIAHTATLLNDGRVLIAGGRGESCQRKRRTL